MSRIYDPQPSPSPERQPFGARNKERTFVTPETYLDYHATTPVDSRVLAAMWPYFAEQFGPGVSTRGAVARPRRARRAGRARTCVHPIRPGPMDDGGDDRSCNRAHRDDRRRATEWGGRVPSVTSRGDGDMPIASDPDWRSYDAIADRYDDVWAGRFEPVGRALWDLTQPAADAFVLDIGTGTGALPLTLRENARHHGAAVGCDRSMRMLHQARSRVPQLVAVAADALTLPFAADNLRHRDSELRALACPRLSPRAGRGASRTEAGRHTRSVELGAPVRSVQRGLD